MNSWGDQMHIENARNRLLNCKSGPHQRSFFRGNQATWNWTKEQKEEEQRKQEHIIRGPGEVGINAEPIAVVLTKDFADVMFLANAYTDLQELFSRYDKALTLLEDLNKLANAVEGENQILSFIEYIKQQTERILQEMKK